MGERGQMTPLLAVVVLAIGGLVFGLARFGASATSAAQAQSAADAAALAGVVEGPSVAASVAAANGGSVASYEADGAEVAVLVRVRDAWAVARARRVGAAVGGGVRGWVGSSVVAGAGRTLPPIVRRALAQAASLLRQPVPIVGARGNAVDVPASFAARLDTVAARAGLCRRAASSDPVRFALCQRSRA